MHSRDWQVRPSLRSREQSAETSRTALQRTPPLPLLARSYRSPPPASPPRRRRSTLCLLTTSCHHSLFVCARRRTDHQPASAKSESLWLVARRTRCRQSNVWPRLWLIAGESRTRRSTACTLLRSRPSAEISKITKRWQQRSFTLVNLTYCETKEKMHYRRALQRSSPESLNNKSLPPICPRSYSRPMIAARATERAAFSSTCSSWRHCHRRRRSG